MCVSDRVRMDREYFICRYADLTTVIFCARDFGFMSSTKLPCYYASVEIHCRQQNAAL